MAEGEPAATMAAWALAIPGIRIPIIRRQRTIVAQDIIAIVRNGRSGGTGKRGHRQGCRPDHDDRHDQCYQHWQQGRQHRPLDGLARWRRRRKHNPSSISEAKVEREIAGREIGGAAAHHRDARYAPADARYHIK